MDGQIKDLLQQRNTFKFKYDEALVELESYKTNTTGTIASKTQIFA